MNLDMLDGKCLKYQPVGSRITCDPAPTDTDQDVLVLTTAELWDEHLGTGLAASGFVKGGSDCGNQVEYLAYVPMSFQSFTLDKLNLIITFDPQFYQRFMAATHVAKTLNLLNKDDRVMLFQAVLYGNGWYEPFVAPDLPELKMPDYIRPYWVNGSACVEALNEAEARTLFKDLTGSEVEEVSLLPYPASPRLNAHVNPAWGQACPSFCYKPHQCKGHSSCASRPACSE